MMLHDARKPAENGTLQQFNFSRGRMQTFGRGCGGERPFEEFEELNSYIDQIVRPLLPPRLFTTLQGLGRERPA